MSFTKNNVLVIDSTIITGVLILLTITVVGEVETPAAPILQFAFKFFVVISIAPFAMSALWELTDIRYFLRKKKPILDVPTNAGIRLMQIGFSYLILLIGFVMYLEFTKIQF